MPCKKFSKNLLIALLFLAATPVVKAQNNTVSPYSRYGLGDLTFGGFIPQTGMGKTGAALYSNDRINIVNPASLSFDTITCIEAGIRGEVTKLETTDDSQTANGSSMSYLAVGFPVMKNVWGATFGLAPYSEVGYNVTVQQNEDLAGRVNYTYQGDGGLNRFFIGNGLAPFGQSLNKFYASNEYKTWLVNHEIAKIQKKERWLNLIKGFSVGVNASWMFGTFNHIQKVEFVDSTNFLNTRKTSSLTLGDFYLNYGILYTKELKNNYFLNLGITGSNSTNISSTNNSIWYNYKLTAFQFEDKKDTVEFALDQATQTLVPMYWNAGFAIGKKNKWIATAEGGIQNWSEFAPSASEGTLKNSFTAALGTEITPNIASFKYYNRIQYRVGAKYNKSYLTIRETSIDDYSVTIGFGLPLSLKKDRTQKATIHFAFEAGQKGTTEKNLLREKYTRLYLGIILNELWFQKRKYD